ncbi:protein starmaker [Pleuronectes platessa]|uniref:protein starmaker n=1 Tax=Pleuronectes platessa TaxID=8262 RepID=UPI00232A622E|nr:protein starmaker [Pleuronectes platessa]
MAAPKENLMSLGNLTGADRNTFTQQRQHSLKHSLHGPMLVRADFSTPQSRQHLREMHLRRRWQELTERERSAQQHNRQLLQQFDTAQDALRELMARNAAMKTVRIEYEKYLEESAPQWQQHLKEKTAQRKRTTNKTAAQTTTRKSPLSCPVILPGSPKLNPSQQGFPPTFPINRKVPILTFHLISRLLPSSLTPTNSTTSPTCSLNIPSGPGATGIPSAFEDLWGQLHMDEPPHERLVEAETRRAPRETGSESRSSHCSQELDINPVRLSSGQAESSESGRDSSQSSKEKWKKREKRGKTKRTSSDRESCSSQDSSQTSSAIVIARVPVVQSDASCGNSRTSGGQTTKRRSGRLAVGSPQIEKVANDKTKSEGEDSESQKEDSHSTGEESGSQSEDSRSKDAENQSPVDKSDREEESESESVKIENGDAEKEIQESNSGAEQNSEEEMDEEEEEHKDDLGDGAENKKSQGDEVKDVRHVDDDDDDDDDEVSGRKNTKEEEQTEAEDESEDQGDDEDSIKDEDGEKRKQGSASSQDEEENERVENKVFEVEEGSDEEQDGEGEEEEEQRSDEAGEKESDSDDSIISPQENRLKKINIIQEEAAEDEDDDKSGSKTGSSDREEFSEDDIENLLAPQQQTKKTDKDLKVDDKAKATCDNVEIFQVEDNSKKTDQQSDSDEIDDFYD